MEEGISLTTTPFRRKALDWMGQSLTGYAAIAINTGNGLEESIFLFKNGSIVGCAYEIVPRETEWFGQNALPLCFNAASCPQGVLDVVSLSGAQLDLVTAFNNSILLQEPISKNSLDKWIPRKFDSTLSMKTISGNNAISEKKETFERFGLGGIFGRAKE